MSKLFFISLPKSCGDKVAYLSFFIDFVLLKKVRVYCYHKLGICTYINLQQTYINLQSPKIV